MSIKAVFGGGSINPDFGAFSNDDAVKELYALLKKEGVSVIDTARLYTGSEEAIGRVAGREDFIIDTKILGGWAPGTSSKEAILRDTQDSINRLKVKQVDVLYLHAPDPTVPIKETLEAINEVYKKGIFRRFGLSNFSAQQVQEVYDICKSKGYVLPTVYQGNYSPIARKIETLLFPTLRKLGIPFYAYSPLAGGFLTKTTQQLDEGAGRFNDAAVGGIYNKMYNKTVFREALAEWNDIAEKEGTSKAELAYRWVGYNSTLKAELGDAVIFGASSFKQVEQTAQALKRGALSAEAARRINEIWKKVESEAEVDNWTLSNGGH